MALVALAAMTSGLCLSFGHLMQLLVLLLVSLALICRETARPRVELRRCCYRGFSLRALISWEEVRLQQKEGYREQWPDEGS